MNITLRVEGSLVGLSLAILREEYDRAATEGSIRLDLGLVDFADRAAIAFLRELLASGVTLEHCQPFLREALSIKPSSTN